MDGIRKNIHLASVLLLVFSLLGTLAIRISLSPKSMHLPGRGSKKILGPLALIPAWKRPLTLVQGLPAEYRDLFRPYAETTLSTASHYRLDPFYLTAVMWTESHFNPRAVSSVGALGLMQLMPLTAWEIIQNRKLDLANKEMRFLEGEVWPYPHGLNIDLGAWYLNYLLKVFSGNLPAATVAYNIGPQKVKELLARGNWYPEKNSYWKKINERAHFLKQQGKKIVCEDSARLCPTLSLDLSFSRP